MRNIISAYVDRFRHERKTQIRFATILLVLALAVAVLIFWRLQNPGVAMANDTYCGYEEHVHTEDCYAQVLSCGLEETDGHIHDESCQTTAQVLTCSLEESEGHSHSDSCYDEDGNLICGLEESTGHTHSDVCYEEQIVLVCGLSEEEPHIHDESCYEKVLTCDIPEHEHTILCMCDETADVETASDWEATLPGELTGVWANDVVLIAQSQLGYTESEKNFQYDEDTDTQKGYTRYGAWYGIPYGDWCAMFVSFCLNYAEVPEETFPEAAGVYAWTVELDKLGLYADASDYEPVPGDIIFFDPEDIGQADHVGIVEEVETEIDEETGEETVVKITTIEGNYGDAVCENEYQPDDGIIVGYGILPEQEDAPEVDSDALYAVTETDKDEIVTLAVGEGEVLDGDYAYLHSVEMRFDQDSGKYVMTTGTSPWDDDDEAGNDSSKDNDILRTYDVATYSVTMTTEVRSDAPCSVYDEGDLYFEFVVKGTADKVKWETGSMGWLESKHGVYTVTTEQYGGEDYQVLRGYITLEPSTEVGHAIGSTFQELSIDLRALAMKNGDKLQPQFTFFLAYNDVGLTDDEYKAWGTSSYSGPMVTFEGKECAAVDENNESLNHGLEYHTITAPEVTISAAPRYNLAIVNSTASKTQQIGSYDFGTGNGLALDKDAGEYYGRLGSYGLVVQIVGKDASNGLRGVELPAEGETLTVSFTLDLSSNYTSGTTVYETGKTSNGQDLTKYAPLVWSFDVNKSGSSQQDERTLPTSTKYADQVPYNKLRQTSDAYWYDSCYDGGSWNIKDNKDGTYTVTITGCTVDMDQLPYIYPGAGTSLSYNYYNPNDISYSPNDNTQNNYWEVQTACLSAGELWVVQPYYAGEKDDGTTYIAQMLGEGTYSVTLKDTSFEVKEGDTVLQTDQQALTTDDSVGQSMTLVNPGTIDQHIAYIKYDYAAYNDPLTDGCFSSAKDWILQGDQLGIETYVTNDSAEEGNTGVAYDVMIKFDDAFFEPDGTIKFSGYLNGETRTNLWAAKPDKTGWDHTDGNGNVLKPDEDGYDTEMINATPDDLIYFSSLSDLESAGYTCVGVLVQYRGLMTEQQNHIHTYLLGTSKTTAETDQVYMVTPYCRSWDRDDLAKAMAADSTSEYYGNENAALSALLNMTRDEVNAQVNKYIPTRTASNSLSYEDDSGNGKDYPSAHWINGDSRHPTTAAGGSSRTPTILNYVKCSYDENGCHEGRSGNYYGDSCLLVGYRSGLTLRVAQQTTLGDGTKEDKRVFDMDTGQTVVDFVANPFITFNNGEDRSETMTYTDVVVTVTLPENMTYIAGSSYIGGNYETVKEGQQGTVTGGVQLTEGVGTTFTYTVDGVEYTVGVLLTVGSDENGNQVLIYTFTNVPVTGAENMQYLEEIFFSCEISSGAVSDRDELVVKAEISCTADEGIDPTMRADGEVEKGIEITKESAVSLVKNADKTVVEVNDEIAYTIDIGDNSSNNIPMIAVDNLPYNGDGYSTFISEDCEVYVTEFSAFDVDQRGLIENFHFFYTTNKKYANMTSADYPGGEYFVTNLGESGESVSKQCIDNGWVEMKMQKVDKSVSGYDELYTCTDLPKETQIYAIVGVGIITGTDDINMHVSLKLSDPEPGDVVVNRLTQQHAISTINDEGEIEVAYENLSDSARVRVVGRKISGTVWLDEDMDGGIRTGKYENEQLLSGVTVELQTKDKDGSWVTAQKLKYDEVNEAEPTRLDEENGIDPADCITKTDEDGYYEFDYLPEGEYRVVVKGEGTGDASNKAYTLAEHEVTACEAEDIDTALNSKVERENSDDCISVAAMPAATAISGSDGWYVDAYENAGYTQYIPFTVNKKWTDLEGNDITGQRTSGSVVVQITETDDVVLEAALSPENHWTDTIENLPYYDGSGKQIDYTASNFTVKEIEGNEGYTFRVGDIIKNADGSYSVTVTNQAGTELPLTGGRGTTIFYIIGAVLVCGIGVTLVTRRRMKRAA